MQNQVILKIIDLFVKNSLIVIWIIFAVIFLYFARLEIKKSRGEYNKYKNEKLNIFLRLLDFIWRKKYLWLLFCVGLISSLYLIITESSKNDHLIFYTLLVIFWYSRETMDLKQISNKQTERLRIEHKTNLRPYLRIQKKEGENKILLVNEGKGVAVNLRSTYKRNNYKVELPGITAMAAAPGSFTEGLTSSKLGINFDSDEECIIEIFFNDIEMRNYHAIFKRNFDYNDKFEIIEQKEI